MTAEPTKGTNAAVIVGVDGSSPSKLALQWGHRMATALQAPLEAVIAWPTPVMWIGAGWSAAPTDFHPEDDARKVIDSAVTEALGPPDKAAVELSVANGGAAKVLVERSRTARLLVLGSRGHGGFGGLLLGSVSSACAEHAACPVLVVHGAEPVADRRHDSSAPVGRIVVAVDGSDGSKQALRAGQAMAAMLDATLEAVTVWQLPAVWSAGAWADVRPDWHPAEDARAMLEHVVAEVLGDDHDPIKLTVSEGNPARVLAHMSADATALVVGSRGHGGFTGLLLGSVSARCAERATCPVLVVHGELTTAN